MSKKKRTSLDSLFADTIKDARPPTAAPGSERQPASRSEPARERLRGDTSEAQHKKQTVYLGGPVYEQLRRLAFDERRKMHDYLIEGLDCVFRNRGLPSIAELEKKERVTSDRDATMRHCSRVRPLPRCNPASLGTATIAAYTSPARRPTVRHDQAAATSHPDPQAGEADRSLRPHPGRAARPDRFPAYRPMPVRHPLPQPRRRGPRMGPQAGQRRHAHRGGSRHRPAVPASSSSWACPTARSPGWS